MDCASECSEPDRHLDSRTRSLFRSAALANETDQVFSQAAGDISVQCSICAFV
jgi:hypothetical protein